MFEIDPSLATPRPDSAAEHKIFQALQARLPELFRIVFPDPCAPRTVVIVPSLSLDQDVLARLIGVHHYEERMLCMLMLLKMPRTRIVYVTSQPLSEEIIDYYLHLLPGIPATHARRRLTLLSCFNSTPQPLAANFWPGRDCSRDCATRSPTRRMRICHASTYRRSNAHWRFN